MKVLSVNIGSLNFVLRNGKKVKSGIFKKPIEGSIELSSLGFEGDYQANKKLHGGIEKAICVYPSEHYEAWRNELRRPGLSYGDFGENLTTLGLLEHEVCLGDRFRIGSAEIVVTQPREPCITLNARIGLIDLSARFKKSGRSGFYFSVVKEGTISSGDLIKSVSKDENRVSVSEFNQVINRAPEIEDIIHRASKVNDLPQKLKNKLLKIKNH